MIYNIKIYETTLDNRSRFALGTTGEKPLFVIGLNPSIACDKEPDLTIKKVMKFAENGGFDSFVMLNLYAQRTPFPENMHNKLDIKLHERNLGVIVSTLKQFQNPNILASWGETIRVKPFLIKCLFDIYYSTENINITWLKIGNFTKSNHPRHPSRAPYKMGLTKFDIKSYLEDKIN